MILVLVKVRRKDMERKGERRGKEMRKEDDERKGEAERGKKRRKERGRQKSSKGVEER